MKIKLTNIIVISVIFLIIITSFIPSITALKENENKTDSTIWIFGLMRPFDSHVNQTKVFVLFALYKSQGLAGGFLKPFTYYYFWDMVDFTKNLWAFCWCSNFTES